MLNDDHIIALDIATFDELKELKQKALRINEVLIAYFKNFNLDLIDFKIEFGKTADGEILLADEVSPDTCRLWDSTTKQKFDKDVFRRDIAPLRETYQALADKLGIS
jgi:phosphoribosylaminoimidazole-succinocarboxamide synthase